MKKRLISLRTAILLPFVLVVFLILGIFMFLWAVDYNWLVNEQGAKFLTALSTNTNQELNTLLSEPLRINELFASTITNNRLYGMADSGQIESITTDYLKKLAPSLPQISVISYGDENKNYVGLRKNSSDNSYSLMLQDTRTNNILNIYESDRITSRILVSYEGYDPRTRPWYVPVKLNPVPMWSEIYVNADEKMEATISSLVPVFDESKRFRGVCDVDVKLDGINEFLRSNTAKGTGAIYIIDKDWKVIAHSGNETVMKVIPGTTPTAELMGASDSLNPLVSSSSRYLIANHIQLDKITKLKIAGINAFALISKMQQPSDLNWRVVVIIPENDLMGAVKQRQNVVLLITVFISLIGIIIGSVTVSRVILPILKSVDASKLMAGGNFDVTIDALKSNIYETEVLVQGFNSMSEKIKDSFNQLLEAKTELERLHEMEKNKLASLGGLVDGVSHEINTPLGVAVSAGSLVASILHEFHEKISSGSMSKADFLSNMESMDESISIMNDNLYRVSSLIKSFKQIAVNTNLEMKTNFFVVNYIETVQISLKHLIGQKIQKVVILCDDNLEINSYPDAFTQILTILIMNSLNHGFEDGNENKESEISIGVSSDSINVTITYSDNGRGIDPEILPKVFDPFFTTNRSKGGVGLGLNIVYNIVTNQLKGIISCKSEVGIGTTFKIVFPL